MRTPVPCGLDLAQCTMQPLTTHLFPVDWIWSSAQCNHSPHTCSQWIAFGPVHNANTHLACCCIFKTCPQACLLPCAWPAKGSPHCQGYNAQGKCTWRAALFTKQFPSAMSSCQCSVASKTPYPKTSVQQALQSMGLDLSSGTAISTDCFRSTK